jgi:superfamily II RNA helicase
VVSQIRVNFSMVLNLLLSHRPAEVEELLSRSLAAFSARRRGDAARRAALPSNPAQSQDLVREFRHHLQFLQLYDYATGSGLLSDDGLWAARLRVDQPLLIAEGLRQGLMPVDDPPALAGVIAAFVNDRDLGERFDRRLAPKSLLAGFLRLRRGLRPFAQHLFREGFGVRPLFFRPALALHAWTRGAPWEEVCQLAEMDEGSLATLVLRTADHLRHIQALADAFPQAAATASEAERRALREPVV